MTWPYGVFGKHNAGVTGSPRPSSQSRPGAPGSAHAAGGAL